MENPFNAVMDKWKFITLGTLLQITVVVFILFLCAFKRRKNNEPNDEEKYANLVQALKENNKNLRKESSSSKKNVKKQSSRSKEKEETVKQQSSGSKEKVQNAKLLGLKEKVKNKKKGSFKSKYASKAPRKSSLSKGSKKKPSKPRSLSESSESYQLDTEVFSDCPELESSEISNWEAEAGIAWYSQTALDTMSDSSDESIPGADSYMSLQSSHTPYRLPAMNVTSNNDKPGRNYGRVMKRAKNKSCVVDDFQSIRTSNVETILDPGFYSRTPWDTTNRAYDTLPSESLQIADSTIPNAGKGVFAKKLIKNRTWLGEYEGEILTSSDALTDYTWHYEDSDQDLDYYIDGNNIETSNWLRWVNCSRHSSEENVEIRQCKGKIFYVTTKDISPGEELLIYYGDAFAKELGVDVDNYEKNN